MPLPWRHWKAAASEPASRRCPQVSRLQASVSLIRNQDSHFPVEFPVAYLDWPSVAVALQYSPLRSPGFTFTVPRAQAYHVISLIQERHYQGGYLHPVFVVRQVYSSGGYLQAQVHGATRLFCANAACVTGILR